MNYGKNKYIIERYNIGVEERLKKICTYNIEPRIELEMTLCMWRNHFTCDILAENGTAHIESLCKWGPSKFTYRKRVFPSGLPIEKKKVIKRKDNTWKDEYTYFKTLVDKKDKTNLTNDLWIYSEISKIFNKAQKST